MLKKGELSSESGSGQHSWLKCRFYAETEQERLNKVGSQCPCYRMRKMITIYYYDKIILYDQYILPTE